MTVRSYKDLEVWKKGMELVTVIYKLTQSFPREEIYGLTSQMRRAAVSIPSNIAEGRGKRSTKDFVRYLHIAHGSLAELETQIMISERLGYLETIPSEALQSQTASVGRMINGMVASLEKKLSNPECRMPDAECGGRAPL